MLKKLLLGSILGFMFIHMAFNEFKIIDIPPLKGYIYKPEKVELNDRSWFSGEYQLHQEDYMTSMFGFRSLYVRFHNQLGFLLFKKVYANGVVLGKENYLYEQKYIDSYKGKDFLGLDSIDLKVKQMKLVSDGLAKVGKQLVIVFAPSKASFYPEFIPDSFKKINDSTNYKFFSKGVKAAGLNVIDFNKWFIENKYRSKYPLYPKYANHWSNYGAVLAADSLINYIQYLRNIDLPNISYDTVDMKQPFGIDYDIADGMNLFVRFKSVNMAYPRIHFENDEKKIRPAVLVIGDSFYWNMYGFGISKSFKDDHFWYYNEQVYPETAKEELLTSDIDITNEIEKHDVFIVMATESNLSSIGWGFFENLQNFFTGSWEVRVNALNLSKKLKQMKKDIQTDNAWMEQIRQKATARNISVDSMLTIDAQWLMENQAKK
ncbi:MAG: hypothetical protein ABIP51_07190 [Bacteroidia bacterium]